MTCRVTYLPVIIPIKRKKMTNHNHLSFFEVGQQKINFVFYELSLPDDNPVFTLKNVMEEMDFTALLAQYSGKGKSGFNSIMKFPSL